MEWVSHVNTRQDAYRSGDQSDVPGLGKAKVSKLKEARNTLPRDLRKESALPALPASWI